MHQGDAAGPIMSVRWYHECETMCSHRICKGARRGGFPRGRPVEPTFPAERLAAIDDRARAATPQGAKMRQKSGPEKQPAEDAIRDIRRAMGRLFSAEEKIGVVLEGLRGEESIADGEGFGG
jgi:hypothetical protein